MHERKERIINEVVLLKENQELLKIVMAGMRRRVHESSKKWGTYPRKRN